MKRLQIHVKYRNEKGGWPFVKCDCCGQKRIFDSWAAVNRFVEENGIERYIARRVRR